MTIVVQTHFLPVQTVSYVLFRKEKVSKHGFHVPVSEEICIFNIFKSNVVNRLSINDI